MLTPITKTLLRTRDAIAWRLHRMLGDKVVYGSLLASARLWRRLLRKPIFIGVAGSAGKTTAKELMLGMLAHHGKGVGNIGSFNNIEEIAKAILRARPWHSFFVTELSEDRPGVMDGPLELVRPTVGIVTVVGDDHLTVFASRQGIAKEMGKLVASLPTTGTAVLNADDPAVLAMASACAAKILTYGLSPDAQLRAEDISSSWPDRLQMTLVHGSERVKLVTKLCGTHWIPSVLGAIGGGLATGMTLQDCATGLAKVAPFNARMEPITTSDGVTFVRDDFKAPLWTISACFEFMKVARAKRKIIVIGELQEVGPRKGEKFLKTAILAQEIADITVFVGPWASSVLKARRPDNVDSLRAFSHVRDAADYVNSVTREGDLVLLKGANKQDHLLRIILARNGGVNCWRDDCARILFCNECPDRMKYSGAPLLQQPSATASPVAAPGSDRVILEPDEQVVVGLGNPERRYTNTPHNIGYEVLDHLATSLGLTWNANAHALIARGSMQGHRVCLVKVQSAMNLTGGQLKQLSESMPFNPTQCILVYDDLDLSLGTVRTRMSGSAGGHRGVASILEAFQTDSFRRVKVGVGQTHSGLPKAEYVLQPFDATSAETVEKAIAAAMVRVLEIAKAHTGAKDDAKAP